MTDGRLGLFSCFTLSRAPFPTIAQHPAQDLFQQQGLVRSEIKNKLTNIPSKKKKDEGGTHLLCDTWGLFGKED